MGTTATRTLSLIYHDKLPNCKTEEEIVVVVTSLLCQLDFNKSNYLHRTEAQTNKYWRKENQSKYLKQTNSGYSSEGG